MTITGYAVVEYTVRYTPGYQHVAPGTLEWDSAQGQWEYETVYVPANPVQGSKVYTPPFGKKIIWSRDIDRLRNAGSGYELPLEGNYRSFTPRPRPRPSEPIPQPEVNPEWENPPAPPVYTQTETFVIAHATPEIEV